MVRIRSYQSQDRDQVIGLIKAVSFEILKEKKSIEDLRDIGRVYLKKDGVFFVAEKNGRIVGTLAVYRKDLKTAKVRRFYVASDCRGQGVGTKLLEKTLKFCKKRGYKKVFLSTYKEMEQAVSFYKKRGFKRKSTSEKLIFFEKSLSK